MQVHPKSQTPIATTALLGAITAIIALLTAFADLLKCPRLPPSPPFL